MLLVKVDKFCKKVILSVPVAWMIANASPVTMYV